METTRGEPRPGRDEPPPMVAHGLSHTGKRPRNEDRFLIREDLGLAIVADGFGGAAGGDVAARLAVDEIASWFGAPEEQTVPSFEPHELVDGLTAAMARFAIERAHRRVRQEARRTGPIGMSTAVAVLVVAGPTVVVGHSGSVRVYRFRADALEQLTRDVPAGAPTAAPVGTARQAVQPAIRVDAWKAGDVYLLCTAGLHRILGAEPIRCTLATHGRKPESPAALLGRALHAGAADNMTAVVVIPQAAREGKRAGASTTECGDDGPAPHTALRPASWGCAGPSSGA